MTIDYTFLLKTLGPMALVMISLRVLPLWFCKGSIKNRFVKSFLYYVPYAVLTSMVIPEVFFSTASIYSAFVGLLVSCLLAYFGKDLLVVCLSATASAFIVDWIISFGASLLTLS